MNIIRKEQGFTTIERLSATFLTMLFFGWLTVAYITVTRAVLKWESAWQLSSATHQAMAKISLDLERAFHIRSLSDRGITIDRDDGQIVTYAQNDSSVIRNDLILGFGEVGIDSLHISQAGLDGDKLHVYLVTKHNGIRYTCRTVIRLYSLRPQVIRQALH